MREFYVYGFKNREEYTKKSARSYDNERRRLESWLGDYMQFRQTSDGKNVFLSIDSRVSHHNPFYKAWKASSFTDGDITLHFILMDILSDPDKKLPLNEIMDQIDDYLSEFAEPRMFDESTVRKKLKEYTEEGIVEAQKQGKVLWYRRADQTKLCDSDVLDFFSETASCGVIGSFLLDKKEKHREYFAFKHHYITSAMDSEVLCAIFMAMREKCYMTIFSAGSTGEETASHMVVPLRIMISVQNGRQYLMAYALDLERITSFRIDHIVSVKKGEACGEFEELRTKLDDMLPHIWGVSTRNRSGAHMEHVEFTIQYGEEENYIPNRLEREKRCGSVTHFADHTSRFSADVYDASELIPWIRTFICRITEISFSDKELEQQFKNDLEEMYALYGLEGGEDHDLQ
jgi:DNA-binding transcriptional ArsR family regulator